MFSPNKERQDRDEREYVGRIKLLPCCVCGTGGGEAAPSEAHEIEQGLWFTSVPLCADCHRGPRNGIHGMRYAWKVRKFTELIALNRTIRMLLFGSWE